MVRISSSSDVNSASVALYVRLAPDLISTRTMVTRMTAAKLKLHLLDHVLGNSTDLLLSGHIRVGQDFEIEPLVHVDHLGSDTLELGTFLGRTVVVLAPDQVQHGLDTDLRKKTWISVQSRTRLRTTCTHVGEM